MQRGHITTYIFSLLKALKSSNIELRDTLRIILSNTLILQKREWRLRGFKDRSFTLFLDFSSYLQKIHKYQTFSTITITGFFYLYNFCEKTVYESPKSRGCFSWTFSPFTLAKNFGRYCPIKLRGKRLSFFAAPHVVYFDSHLRFTFPKKAAENS